MSTVAKLLAPKQVLMERLEKRSRTERTRGNQRLLAQIETALSLREPGVAVLPGGE